MANAFTSSSSFLNALRFPYRVRLGAQLTTRTCLILWGCLGGWVCVDNFSSVHAQPLRNQQQRAPDGLYSPSREVSSYSGSDIASRRRQGTWSNQVARPPSTLNVRVVPRYHVPYYQTPYAGYGFAPYGWDDCWQWSYRRGYSGYLTDEFYGPRYRYDWRNDWGHRRGYGRGAFYPDCGPVVLPPIVVHSGGLFGAISGQMTAQWFANSYGTPILTVPAGNAVTAGPLAGQRWDQNWLQQGRPQLEADVGQEAPPTKPTAIPAAMVSRAGKFIGQGDRYLTQGKYHRALQRYKRASDAARDLPDPYFRQGFGYASLGMFKQAKLAIERGISLDPNWPASEFSLQQIAGDAFTEQIHARTSEALTSNPLDTDALYLRAVARFVSGEQQAAEDDFHRIAELTGDKELISPFVEDPPQEEAAQETE